MSHTLRASLLVGLLFGITAPMVAQTPIVEIVGANDGDTLGTSMVRIQDLTGDGKAEIALGVPQLANSGPGEVQVYEHDGSLLGRIVGGPNDGQFGYSLSSGFDVDGDGTHDLLIGSPLTLGKGAVYLVSGADGSVLRSLFGTGSGDRFGDQVLLAPDLSGDGVADLVVGIPLSDQGGTDSGAVQVFSGADGSSLYAIVGFAAGDRFGEALAFGEFSDIANGKPDLAIGAPQSDTVTPGHVYTFDGTTGAQLHSLQGSPGDLLGTSIARVLSAKLNFRDSILVGAPQSVFPNAGYALLLSADLSVIANFSGSLAGQSFGTEVAVVDDVSGDGRRDYLITSGSASLERTELFSGFTPFPRLYTFDGFGGSFFGRSLAGLGDVDGDGIGDLAIGAGNFAAGGFSVGKVTLHSGNDLYLEAEPRDPAAGQTVSLFTRTGVSGMPALLVLTSIDGGPLFVPVVRGKFDASGTFDLSGSLPAGLTGIALGMAVFSIDRLGRIVATAEEVLVGS